MQKLTTAWRRKNRNFTFCGTSQPGEIHAQLMGEVQIEILKKLICGPFWHVAVEFGAGSIVYKETVAEPVEGVGHFEPLRHYAEVHLLMEPGEPGQRPASL